MSGVDLTSVVGKVHGGGEPACSEARASRSWTRVGGTKLPVWWNGLSAREKSLIAAISISVALGGGAVTSVSGNHAMVSVTRGEDVAVTMTW